MKKPADAGAYGLSKNVYRQVDMDGYAPNSGALQARNLSKRYGLTSATAAALAELAFPIIDNWRCRA